MKRDNNSVILWVVLAAAVLVGAYLFKDKLGICWSGNCKTEAVEEAVVVEATEPVSTESEMPMAPAQSEDVAAVAEEVK